MKKKIIVAVHDKKSDTLEGFMTFNNAAEALRSFEATCQQNETFKKWPEDFQFVQIGLIKYENGEIDDNNEITKEAQIISVEKNVIILAEAKDFVKKEVQKTANA